MTKPLEAEIIKNALEAKRIPCYLDGTGQAAHIGLTVFEIKIQVPA